MDPSFILLVRSLSITSGVLFRKSDRASRGDDHAFFGDIKRLGPHGVFRYDYKQSRSA